jgi:transcriptional regulator with XRE-family HTH domain
MKHTPVQKLIEWRKSRNLTLEEAAVQIVVDGAPTHKATWHAWESGRRVPSKDHMPLVRELTGLSADDFYPRVKPSETPKAPLGQLALV